MGGYESGMRASEPNLAANAGQNRRTDPWHEQKIFRTLKSSDATPRLEDARGKDGSDTRDLLQFLDLCPIHVDGRRILS